MNKKKFYVTTPIYYVNSKPHLGTLYSTLIADAAARWHKLLGDHVFFLTGTDEHGQKIQECAEREGCDPKEFVDGMIKPFKKVWQQYYIEYDRFIRTTDPDHKRAVIYWIERLKEMGDIYKSEYRGWYCVSCEAFINVETESVKNDKGNYICLSHKRELQELAEESYFFRLSAYEDMLLEFYKKNPDFIVPKERMNEVVSFVKSGLKDLSISRKSVKWGIPFPGDPEHTVYVWGDALNNYISAIGYGQQDDDSQKNFEYWWPADMHVMAKDILRFHAVYWPAFLMAAGQAIPKRLLVHGYVLVDEHKMSKSLGNAVDPAVLAEQYGVDQVRYYLLRKMAITHDGCFSLHDLEKHIAADLSNNLGNLLNRTVSLALKNSLKEVPCILKLQGASALLRDKCIEAFRSYYDSMNDGLYHMALLSLWTFISEVNAYFHKMQPWVLAKKDKEAFCEVISASCHSLYAIGVMLWPIMPRKMEQLLGALGHSLEIGINYEDELRNNIWDKTFMLEKQEEPLFTRPESQQEKLKEDMQKSDSDVSETCDTISFKDFVKVDIRVGTIKVCEPVEKSNKLYRLEVDFGNFGMRQILAGVAKNFTVEEMLGKQGAFVVNLAPRMMMGLESQGMMLFVKNDDGTMRLVVPSGDIENGSKFC